MAKEVSAKMFKTIQVGLEDYDGCEIPLERMDDFEPEETYIIPNPVLPDDTHEDEQGELCLFVLITRSLGRLQRWSFFVTMGW